ARAKAELNREETTRREAALRELASYNDTPAIEMIGEQIPTDADHGLRVLGTELLGNSGHPKAVKILEKCLTHADEAVRVAALASLERIYPADSPEANIVALASTFPDLRRLTLIRLFQRKMLGHPKVQAVVRWRGEDADAEVRRTAFLLSLYMREKLVETLRE